MLIVLSHFEFHSPVTGILVRVISVRADQNLRYCSAGILVRRTKMTNDFGPTPVILVRGGLLRSKISDIVPRGFWSAGP